MSIPFDPRREANLLYTVVHHGEQEKADEALFQRVAATFDAADWVAAAAEEAAELSAALTKLNRVLGRGIPTDVTFEQAYDAVLEEMADTLSDINTAHKLLSLQRGINSDVERKTVAVKGPLTQADRETYLELVMRFKRTRFANENAFRLKTAESEDDVSTDVATPKQQ